jgi:hypothetical protein
MITARQRLDCGALNLRQQRAFLAFFPFAVCETPVWPEHDSAANTS